MLQTTAFEKKLMNIKDSITESVRVRGDILADISGPLWKRSVKRVELNHTATHDATATSSLVHDFFRDHRSQSSLGAEKSTLASVVLTTSVAYTSMVSEPRVLCILVTDELD